MPAAVDERDAAVRRGATQRIRGPQLLYASVNWGAGITGYLPWPAPHYADRHAERPDVVGWRTTSWEASFARLLTQIAGHDEFQSRTEEVAAGMLLEQRHPARRLTTLPIADCQTLSAPAAIR
jgi:hypothetical protein